MDVALLRVPEIAERLGMSRTKIYELLAAGELPSVKVAGCRRVRVADLDDFVTQLSGEWQR